MREHLSALKAFLRDTAFRRRCLAAGIGLLLFALMGFFSYLADPDTGDILIAQFTDILSDSGVIDEGSGTISVFALLQNNWAAMLIVIVYGLIPFLQLPVLSLFTNGVLLGVMGGVYWLSDGVDMALFLAALLPHGIFELSALALAVACGMYLCRNVGLWITRRNARPDMTAVFSDLLRVLLFMIAPLTVIAAFVEAYVTPAVITLFL